MEVLHEGCAGLDISEKGAKVCVRTPSTKRRGSFATETTTWSSTANAVLALLDHLVAANVTLVVIETTSDCWKPFYYVLAEDLNVILGNARQAPASNCPRLPSASWASPAGPCSKPSSAVNATRKPSRTWPNAGSAARSPNSPKP
ncbi:hypothetical protein [Streptomyces sp. NPDC056480]|uniref:hypothetical protein n=1 Tax=Streptomyces sp. NPDC056480 TaxID=3345833 RepID=UPI0036924D98